MNFKSMFFSAVILSACGLPLMAQDGPPPEGGKGPRGPMAITAESLKTDLNLTDDQVTKLQPMVDKIKALMEETHKEMKAQRESGTIDREAMKTKMESNKKKILEIIAPAKDFLSAEQYQTLTDKFTKRPEHKKGGKPAK